MKKCHNFDNAGVRSIRASGTQWITYKISSMTWIIEKFDLCITLLENATTDTSQRAKEHNRIKGLLNKWKNSKIQKLLKPILQLSLKFQKEKIDKVFAAIALGKVKGKLLQLKNKDVNDFNQIKTMKSILKNLKMET